jgi:flagellar biosynthesis/type III secretory pathway protein FliH
MSRAREKQASLHYFEETADQLNQNLGPLLEMLKESKHTSLLVETIETALREARREARRDGFQCGYEKGRSETLDQITTWIETTRGKVAGKDT